MFDTFITYDEERGILDAAQPWEGDCCEACERPVPPGFTLCGDCDLILDSGQWYNTTQCERET